MFSLLFDYLLRPNVLHLCSTVSPPVSVYVVLCFPCLVPTLCCPPCQRTSILCVIPVVKCMTSLCFLDPVFNLSILYFSLIGLILCVSNLDSCIKDCSADCIPDAASAFFGHLCVHDTFSQYYVGLYIIRPIYRILKFNFSPILASALAPKKCHIYRALLQVILLFPLLSVTLLLCDFLSGCNIFKNFAAYSKIRCSI